MDEDNQTLVQRVDRLESRSEIRQLAFKYALAVDMRNIDAIANLYVDNVRANATEVGRQPLKKIFATVLRAFTASVHHVGNQIIEFDSADEAHGITYCRCEHEVGNQWVPMYLYYLDLYSRRGGVWYFKRRATCELYAAPSDEAPVGDRKIRWPGREPVDGTWHAHFASWREFWEKPEHDDAVVRSPFETGSFIDGMRRGERRPIPPDFSWAMKQEKTR